MQIYNSAYTAYRVLAYHKRISSVYKYYARQDLSNLLYTMLRYTVKHNDLDMMRTLIKKYPDRQNWWSLEMILAIQSNRLAIADYMYKTAGSVYQGFKIYENFTLTTVRYLFDNFSEYLLLYDELIFEWLTACKWSVVKYLVTHIQYDWDNFSLKDQLIGSVYKHHNKKRFRFILELFPMDKDRLLFFSRYY